MAVFVRQTGVVLVSLLAALALLLAPSAARGEPVTGDAVDEDSSGAPYVAGELLVTYKEQVPESAPESLDVQAETKVEETLAEIDVQVVEFPEVKDETSQAAREQDLGRAKAELEQDPAVESVDYNYLMEADYTPNDPRFGDQWNLKRADFDAAWNRVRGRGAKIAVIDSGATTGHPDLKRKIVAKRDFRNEDTPNSVKDYTGHGTHMAGTAAASTGNGIGVAGGCPRCKLMIAKYIGRDGIGTTYDFIEGVLWSANHGADVISVSSSGASSSDALKRAINRATEKGAVVVASAGNQDSSKPRYPAAYRRVIAVAATNRSDQRASFSGFGSWVDVAAPGIDIVSTVPGGYASFDGTSPAVPNVSALAGLLASQNRGPKAIRKRILSTAVDLGANGRDPYFGAGRIDADRATKR
jgi:thermitase